jgi:hypothetical protein
MPRYRAAAARLSAFTLSIAARRAGSRRASGSEWSRRLLARIWVVTWMFSPPATSRWVSFSSTV